MLGKETLVAQDVQAAITRHVKSHGLTCAFRRSVAKDR